MVGEQRRALGASCPPTCPSAKRASRQPPSVPCIQSTAKRALYASSTQSAIDRRPKHTAAVRIEARSGDGAGGRSGGNGGARGTGRADAWPASRTLQAAGPRSPPRLGVSGPEFVTRFVDLAPSLPSSGRIRSNSDDV